MLVVGVVSGVARRIQNLDSVDPRQGVLKIKTCGVYVGVGQCNP